MSKSISTLTTLLVAMAYISFGCQKRTMTPQPPSFGPWTGELASMISQDLTQKYWLTGKVNYGEWKNLLAPSVLEAMKAPKITSITVQQTRKPTVWSDLMSAEIRITFKTADDGDYTVDTDYHMPVRGKNWIAIGDTDWNTGKHKFYAARDNYICVISAYLKGPKLTSFQTVQPLQIDGIPPDAYKDLAFRWENGNIIIRDLREKKEYRYKGPTKKGDPYGTVQVAPIR